ncbi:hypothetical protein EVAR_94812_1 [Eumeta japonica]|uniref:Uncharacterized protein n=1 Tax=Eumeta variegata TaxID=151549 RepID=A0A4C1UH36_EUMVA|nr:hypothetical protein EVAR_94812_1 [Eumeta japonica]
MGWYGLVKGSVLLAAGALAAADCTHATEGPSTEGCTGLEFLRFIQSNLQRSELEQLVEAERRKIASRPKGDLAKGTRKSLNSGVYVEEDQTLNDESITATIAGNCRIGVVSVYYEGDMSIGP